jgi:hypothetical protein
MSIEVVNNVPVYELDGKAVELLTRPYLSVSSHWNRCEWVVLALGDMRITVNVRDLKAALENAGNTAKF